MVSGKKNKQTEGYSEYSLLTQDQLFFYNYAVAVRDDTDSPEEKGQVQIQLPADGPMILRYVNAYTLETGLLSHTLSR